MCVCMCMFMYVYSRVYDVHFWSLYGIKTSQTFVKQKGCVVCVCFALCMGKKEVRQKDEVNEPSNEPSNERE